MDLIVAITFFKREKRRNQTNSWIKYGNCANNIVYVRLSYFVVVVVFFGTDVDRPSESKIIEIVIEISQFNFK